MWRSLLFRTVVNSRVESIQGPLELERASQLLLTIMPSAHACLAQPGTTMVFHVIPLATHADSCSLQEEKPSEFLHLVLKGVPESLRSEAGGVWSGSWAMAQGRDFSEQRTRRFALNMGSASRRNEQDPRTEELQNLETLIRLPWDCTWTEALSTNICKR